LLLEARKSIPQSLFDIVLFRMVQFDLTPKNRSS
jgi:hypothetical protein